MKNGGQFDIIIFVLFLAFVSFAIYGYYVSGDLPKFVGVMILILSGYGGLTSFYHRKNKKNSDRE